MYAESSSLQGWEIGFAAVLIFAWIGVLIVVAIDIASTARRVTRGLLVALLALAVAGSACTREKIVYRDSPTGATPVAEATPAPSLKFPQGIPDSEIIVIPGIPTLHEVVNQEILAMFPDCKLGDVHCDGHGYDPQSFFAVLNARLRVRGYWAGQHVDGASDEMVIGTSCAGVWQNFHAWAYEGYPIWANTISSPCAGEACRGKGTSYRGNTIIDAKYCK